MKDFIVIVGIVAMIVLVVLVGPLLTIWAVNALFPALAIPYSITNWFAVIILGAFFRANVSIKKD
jgi:urea transporter